MTPHTIVEAAAALRGGRTTSVALVDASLAAIDRYQDATNAFTLVDAGGARRAAADADRERADGLDRGPLHGIPISLKDLIDVSGVVTTAGSKVLRDRIPSADAVVVRRLRQAGAVVIGRTNLHEFALGTTSEDSAFGPVRHPRDPRRSAGGSSGGAAAAVATGMGLAAIGTDTGGSVRIPAAACGVVGLKGSMGDVPTDGVIPLCPSFDHVGPIARTVQDAAWIWAVLAGRPLAPVTARPAHAIRLVALSGHFDVLEPAVRAAFDRALERLRRDGVSIVHAELPATETIMPAYVNVVLSEAAAWHGSFLTTRGGDYTPAVRARLESGRTITAVDYLAARATCGELREAVDTIIGGADALVLPSLPIVAPLLGAGDATLDRGITVPVRAAMLRHTQLFNMTGHPAISVPIAGEDLPVGLQLAGCFDGTGALLAAAATCEKIVSL